jgi:AcrR family transcriptional regulator
MGHRRRLTPRKKPLQARSQATVEAILQAATYILAGAGWEGFTTNRIAERAGVNIASLYQYFPNKEAIVAQLQERHRDEVRALVPRIVPELAQRRELRAILHRIVEAVIKEHSVAPALHRAFAEQLPRTGRPNALRADGPYRHFEDLLRPFLRGAPDPEIAIFVARKALHAAIHEAAVERPAYLTSALFLDEVTGMLERYLDRGRRVGRARTSPRAR